MPAWKNRSSLTRCWARRGSRRSSVAAAATSPSTIADTICSIGRSAGVELITWTPEWCHRPRRNSILNWPAQPGNCRMGRLTFCINLTLDGCVDHREGIADDETHAFFTRLMDEAGAMLWGRVTYEMMEGYWPAVARGDEEAPLAMREWAVKLEAKPKYVVSSTRKDFPWTHSHHIADD